MKASIIINNFNKDSFIFECVRSALQQDYKNIEVIVYDDGSNDNSISILSSFTEIRLLARNKNPEKPSFCQARAIEESFLYSTGEVIFLLDGDDLFEPFKVSRVMKVFDSNSDVVVVQHASNVVKDGKIVGSYDRGMHGADYLKLYHATGRVDFFNSSSALAFRRAYLEKVLPFKRDGLWRVWPDVRLTRIAPNFGSVVSLPDILGSWRAHHENDSRIRGQELFSNTQGLLSVKKFLKLNLKEKEYKKIKNLITIKIYVYFFIEILPYSIRIKIIRFIRVLFLGRDKKSSEYIP